MDYERYFQQRLMVAGHGVTIFVGVRGSAKYLLGYILDPGVELTVGQVVGALI